MTTPSQKPQDGGAALDTDKARRDIGILLAQIVWLQECLGENLEAEDGALVDQIRADWITPAQGSQP